MKFSGKLWGGAIGFFIAGPIGAAIGAAIGHFTVDKSAEKSELIFRALLYQFILAGQLSAIDGVSSIEEQSFVFSAIEDLVSSVNEQENPGQKEFLRNRFRENFENGVQNPNIYKQTARELAGILNKLDDSTINNGIVEFLVGVSVCDGYFSPEEGRFLKNVCLIIGVSEEFLESLLRQFVYDYNSDFYEEDNFNFDQLGQNLDKYFKELELNPGASVDEVKKACRRLVRDLHPDRYQSVDIPESLKKMAEEKLIRVNKAYEVLMEYYEKG